MSFKPIRLDLGCGEVYLPGYVNVDFSPDAQTVQSEVVADLYADLKSLEYPPESVAEIRLHRVFEHFTRRTAIGLLIRWYGPLVEGGTVTMKTPDLERMAHAFMRARLALRDIFGSHEAEWAIHCDGRYPEKFEHVLSALGYRDLELERSKWRRTHNVTAVARTRRPFAEREDQLAAAERLLRESLVDDSPSERRQLQTWLDEAASRAS